LANKCSEILISAGIIEETCEVVGPAEPVFAVAGEDAILPCSVKPSISVVDMRVEWFRLDLKDSQPVHLYEDHDDRNTDQIQSYRGRTKLIHQELQRGDASLKLSSVRVSDEGLYKCFIQSRSWHDDATVNVRVEAVGRPPGWYPEPDLEFSVKHSITVHRRDSQIHCRVKVRHHMLEALIISSSNMFNSWRASVILIVLVVVLSVIAGILIAVFVHKNGGKMLVFLLFYLCKYSSGNIQAKQERCEN
uniref:Ig-like domain-containing protein n=1 Tax=Sinocyclocheilus grahami TaxID=75366 RepID=A0A672N4Z1_SINGR